MNFINQFSVNKPLVLYSQKIENNNNINTIYIII